MAPAQCPMSWSFRWTNRRVETKGNSTWLPPFTQPVAPGVSQGQVIVKPGYTAARIKAFIRAVQLFFTVSSVPTSALPPEPGEPTTFALPAFDPITLAMPSFGSGFTFGSTVPSSDATLAANMTAAVDSVFPNDPEAQVWLSEALTSINELYEIALAATPPSIPSGFTPPDPSLSLCVMNRVMLSITR
jgi:hypothetical protein